MNPLLNKLNKKQCEPPNESVATAIGLTNPNSNDTHTTATDAFDNPSYESLNELSSNNELNCEQEFCARSPIIQTTNINTLNTNSTQSTTKNMSNSSPFYREQSPSNATFMNSSTLYINQPQQQSIPRFRVNNSLPKPYVNFALNGDTNKEKQSFHRLNSPHITIHASHNEQPPIPPRIPTTGIFSLPNFQLSPNTIISNNSNTESTNKVQLPFTLVSSKRVNNNVPIDVERKLAALTLALEKELESEATVGEYYGQCTKCEHSVTNAHEGCQAMGNLYHKNCFKCVLCRRTLCGKAFYNVADQVYCEEDYLFSAFQQTIEKCVACDHLIMDTVLQAMGNTYHPGCFRCYVCNECLDGVPFTIDNEYRIFCLYDYHNTYAPRCAKCGYQICPEDGFDETVRIVAMNKNYHVSCYKCEDCDCQLSDNAENLCYPLNETLLCYNCSTIRTEN
ncbi:unnamed protein product [Didymodactylos carnosus]|uniref:LIM zinc-binding domain-containing protein n=1 Tax=Didymodactylos carnosus TaxID=1234261 RepID=A0A813V8D9_9BILA|nr:unnamed protein product [Didymodactylos carnosus]CAF0837413.1 unnamed protein product [Didymodactylos carnosus]CAF3532037.1 unnamed protein product [Didymodactylos carnosus]CAF3624661.1 unnamed protein product [Didymodactylos carnosus]